MRTSRAVRLTALVGANDQVALACLDQLRTRGIDVPKAISVAGFDDLLAAFSTELTSFGLNPQTGAQAMLNHLLTARGCSGEALRPLSPA